jgi:hypothetical protein
MSFIVQHRVNMPGRMHNMMTGVANSVAVADHGVSRIRRELAWIYSIYLLEKEHACR